MIIALLGLMSLTLIAMNSSTNAVILPEQDLLQIQKSELKFISKADLETIQAASNKLKGKIIKSTNKFEFVLSIESFMGFNSPLQREHFLENYMEANVFPKATYAGTVIDPVEWDKQGVANFRTKGKLSIHGVTKECVIKVQLINDGELRKFKSEFSVLLKDYNIAIPRLVKQKINEEIKISVSGTLQ